MRTSPDFLGEAYFCRSTEASDVTSEGVLGEGIGRVRNQKALSNSPVFRYPIPHMTTSTPSKSLPRAWDLVVDSWSSFTKNWNTTIKTSVLFLYAGLITFVGALLTRSSDSLAALNVLVSLGAGALTVWASVRLLMLVLRLEDKKKPQTAQEEGKMGWQLFLPYLWVSILSGLVVFGASLLLILPGIYFGVALSMTDLFLVDKGERGTQALAASRALVKGRWWDVAWRLLVGGVLFGLLMLVVNGALTFAVSLITGPGFFSSTNTDLLAYGVTQFLQMLVMAVFLPLVVAFQVKLFRALLKTKA